MALDKNDFDDFLKDKPWRDLVFRAVVWFAISGAAAYLALHKGVRALLFLDRVAASVAPLVNLVGTFAVLLTVPAVAFKDLEFVAPGTWGQDTRRGRMGGVVRRLAGDLLLWTLGAFTALLSAIGVAAAIEGVKEGDTGPVASVVTKLVVVTAIAALLSIGVRRAGPSPLVEVTKRADGLIVLYALIVGMMLLAVKRSA